MRCGAVRGGAVGGGRGCGVRLEDAGGGGGGGGGGGVWVGGGGGGGD